MDTGLGVKIRNQRVLAIDDDGDFLALLRRMAPKNVTVDALLSGEDIVSYIEADPPGLVLLDVHMPGLDGISVCRAIRRARSHPPIPVILLTNDSTMNTHVRGMEAGAYAILDKAFSHERLCAIFQEMAGEEEHF